MSPCVLYRRFSGLAYGFLFFVGMMFGCLVMFYSSVDLSRLPVNRYLWSNREQVYVPVGDYIPQLESQHAQFVLVVTYMRSGSSFTGDILQHLPESFYVFEPLISTRFDRAITYQNGTKRVFKTDEEVVEQNRQELIDWFNCDLHKINSVFLSHVFMDLARQTSQYVTCVGKEKSKKKMKECLPAMIDSCKKSKVRIIKTIRMTMKSVFPLLKRFDNLKIIHLIRDPRGIFNSRVLTEPGMFPKNKLRTHVTDLCREMSTDVALTNSIKKQYDNRLMILQYETLAESPYKTTARLNSFLGLTPTLEVYGYVFCITSMNGVAERNYDIKRGNSTLTANKWKTRLSRREINLIDTICKTAYKSLGYIPLETKDNYKNASFKSRIDIFS